MKGIHCRELALVHWPASKTNTLEGTPLLVLPDAVSLLPPCRNPVATLPMTMTGDPPSAFSARSFHPSSTCLLPLPSQTPRTLCTPRMLSRLSQWPACTCAAVVGAGGLTIPLGWAARRAPAENRMPSQPIEPTLVAHTLTAATTAHHIHAPCLLPFPPRPSKNSRIMAPRTGNSECCSILPVPVSLLLPSSPY